MPIVANDQDNPTLSELEDKFNVETVSKEFYLKYRTLYENLVKELDSNKTFLKEAEKNNINTENFAKKLLGQIVFLYFLQKKGWLGATLDKKLNQGDKSFLRSLFIEAQVKGKNYFNDYLEFLFYESLNKKPDRSADFYRSYFNCQIPFLNGGLFEPEYKWQDCSICLDNSVFSDILDTFDLFNFTVKEDEPLDKEVAVDPELLGRVFENLLPENLRKGKGTYYTPREIVHYMCQESLINFLDSNSKIGKIQAEKYVKFLKGDEKIKSITAFEGEAMELDGLLENIKIVDPACGSGAFLVGMLQEIVRLRLLLRMLHPSKLKSKTESQLKKEAIRDCIYGVDIDPGAVEIAKLRLWLSLVVDYELKDIEPLPNLDYKIMQGNSLLEDLVIGDTTIKLSGLKNQSANSNMKNLFDKENQTDLFGEKETHNKIIEKLTKLHKEYFKLSDLEEKRRTKTEIEKLEYNLIEQNVNKELDRLENQNKNLGKYLTSKAGFNQKDEKKFSKNLSQRTKIMNILEEYKNTGVKPFFLWHLYFADVFEKGGFDVVIANPPYIDSEGMVKSGQEDIREIIKKSYKWTRGNWDIYIAFFEVGFKELNQKGTLTFITPDKWISKPFGDELRKGIIDNIFTLLRAGRKVFESVNVDSIISLFSKQKHEELKIVDFVNGEFISVRDIDKKTLLSPFTLDHLFSDNLGLLLKIEGLKNRLSDMSEAENACATSDAYKLEPLVFDLKITPFNSEKHLKIVNTGTISKYHSKWGKHKMTYLGHKYLFPVVKKKEFLTTFKNSYANKSVNPKIIIKGLNLLDGCLDNEGFTIPGKTTLIIVDNDIKKLKLLLAIINCRISNFYIKERYSASSYNQGTSFTKEMINNFPMPKISDASKKEIINLVDKILTITKSSDYLENSAKQAKVHEYEKQIDQMVYKLYGLNEDEITIIEDSKI